MSSKKLNSSKRKCLESPFTFRWENLKVKDEEIIYNELKRVITEEKLSRPVIKGKMYLTRRKDRKAKKEAPNEITKSPDTNGLDKTENMDTEENLSNTISTSTTNESSSYKNLSSWFVMGINAVTKALERKELAALVIFTKGAPSNLFRHLYFMASEKDVPMVVMNQSQNNIASLLNMKSLLTLGLKKNLDRPRYKSLLNVLEEKCVQPCDMRPMLPLKSKSLPANKKARVEIPTNPKNELQEDYFKKFTFTRKIIKDLQSSPLPKDLKDIPWT